MNKVMSYKDKKRSSLSREIAVWILSLSLLPLIIISWVNYQQASDGLSQAASEKLEQSSDLTVRFINNWFEYRLMDLNSQAESTENVHLLNTLVEGYKLSGKNIGEYVKSYDWEKRVDGLQDNLITLSRRYDYIYDLLLIDNESNIIFSVTHGLDFGTNLNNGKYKKTLFSKSVRETLLTGKVRFSDLERYAPSHNSISGFLTAPLLDKFGAKLGVFAIQIRLERIFEVIQASSNHNSSLTHYIVGEDARLRTSNMVSSSGRSDYEVLNKVIDTEQFNLWKKTRDNKKYLGLLSEEVGGNKSVATNDVYGKHEEKYIDVKTHKYIGPNGNKVIGLHKELHLNGINWILISEVDEEEALSSIDAIAQVIFVVLFISIVSIVVLTVYQTRRITKPIISMLDISLKVASGKTNQHVDITTNNEVGQLAEAFNIMLDKRQKYEEELEKTTAQAEVAFHKLEEQKFAVDQHSILAITDVTGEILVANAKFCEISGYSEKELIGQNHRLLNSGFHDVSFFKDMYHIIANGGVWHNEVCNKAKDGHNYWVDTTVVPFMGENGKPKSYIAIRTDITQIKQTELELLKAKDIAESATQQKSEFLANMSHEIRTPMNGVIGMTGLLLDTPLDSKQRDYAENTMHSAEALLAIINDILDFSKIEAGKMELELLPFDIQALMEDVSELMAMKCREKNIEMLLRFKLGTQTNVIGDPGRVRQILLNLLSNAIKFTEIGNVLLTVSSEQIDNNRVNLVVSVSDSGIGIEDDKLEQIFNKFDQEDGSTTRKYGGTGLGLAICKQLCQLMEGDITVESQKGHGSVFSFNMALDISDTPSVSSFTMGDVDNLAGLKTLIVDDLDIAKTILVEQLSSLHLDIQTASSGKEALEKLRQAIDIGKPFDIVLSDFHMPEMDGEMLAVEIKKQSLLNDGALLFITSSPRKGDGNRLKELGFDGYLTKPTRANEVSQIMALIWNAKQAGKDIPLVTRHMVQEVKTGRKRKLKLKNVHVLLAEDNPVNQMVATEYLERYGCSVSPAGNGLEAIAELKSSSFDLIFMDCQMPEMDGYEATGVIRTWEKLRNLERTPIIAFTANVMQGDKEKCLNAGMDDYISKPVSEKSLENVLKKWLPDNIDMTQLQAESEVVKGKVMSNVNDDFMPLDLSVFNVLKEMFGDAFSAAIESHTTSGKGNISLIEKALNSNDANKLEHAAHSLKGASGQFGAMKLSELARQMEVHAKEETFEDAKIILNELIASREEAEKLMLVEIF